jgi:hypothetical protein
VVIYHEQILKILHTWHHPANELLVGCATFQRSHSSRRSQARVASTEMSRAPVRRVRPWMISMRVLKRAGPVATWVLDAREVFLHRPAEFVGFGEGAGPRRRRGSGWRLRG